jgi:endonuclease/exonuclease/phosphatase (EEP) superfamily protein YafD
MIALQETTPRWEQALPKQLRKQYKWIRFHHAGGAGGMAFLSKYPVLSSQLLSPPKGGWFTAWKLQIKTPIGQTDILNVHLRPPLPANGKLSSIPKAYLFHTPAIRKRELQTYLGNQPPTQHTIVLGDFNENRHGKAFRWLRKTHHMKSALAAFDRTSYTWYWPTRYWTFKDRYDHIMHSTTLQATHAAVLPDGGSDHRPVLAVFQQHTKK